MKRRAKFYFLASVILVGLIISVSDLFYFLEKNVISSYIVKSSSNDNFVVVTVEEEAFKENRLWPWSGDWPKYLISFLLDIKPQKLVLGPYFTKEVKDLNDFGKILNSDKLLIPYSDKIERNVFDFKSHMVLRKKGFYSYSYVNYEGLATIGYFLGNKKLSFREDQIFKKFFFLNKKDTFNSIAASTIALSGFLKVEGYRNADLDALKGKIIFLEINNENLNAEVAQLKALIKGEIFYILPREFEIYLALFLFCILYILLRSLKTKRAIVVFLICIAISFLLHKSYFNHTRNYIELGPILTFAFLGLAASFIEREYESRIYRKEKNEAQMVRILKEKDILPHSVLRSNGAYVGVSRFKMEKVGGDFYQFLEFAKGELGIVLGWVPGVSFERVRYITEVVHSWRDFASIYKEPGKVMQVLNNSLFRYAEEAKYATFLYALYDAKKGVLKYVNAGHDPIIFINSNSEVRVLEAEEPTPLGVARDVPFHEEEIRIDSNNLLISYSGGIGKLISNSGGLKSDFLESCKKYLEHNPEQLSDEVFHELMKYYPGKPEEEWSLLILKITG